MSKTYNTTGIVLRRGDYREDDRMFIVYTKEYGKIEVVAKGTKKIVSKLNPHLEPLNEVALMVAHGKGFDKLANAIAVERFGHIKSNVDEHGLGVAQYMLEVTEKMVQSRYRDERLYELLREGIHALHQRTEKGIDQMTTLFFAHVYILKLLDHLGYRPELKRCGECNRGIIFPRMMYDFMRGSLVCEECKHITLIHSHYEISDSVIKILNTVLDETFQTLDNYRFNERDSHEFNVIVHSLLQYQYDRPIKTWEYLQKLQSRGVGNLA